MYNQYPQYSPMDAIRRNRISVKSYLGSSNALTIAVLYIISIVLSLITAIVSAPILSQLTVAMYRELDIDMPVSTGFSFNIPVLPILLIVAFILMHSAGKKRNPDTPNAAGAIIFMVVSIIQLVLMCLGIVGAVFIVILAIALGSMASSFLEAGSSSYYYGYGFIGGYIDTAAESAAIIALILALIVVIGVIVLGLVNAIGMVRFSNSIRKGLNSPELTAKGAKAVGVCNVINAIFGGLGIILAPISMIIMKISTPYFYLVDESIFVAYLIALILSSVLSFIMNICMARFAFGFNKHVKAELSNTSYTQEAPVYTVPVQQVAPQSATYYQTSEPHNFEINAEPEPVVSAEPEITAPQTAADNVTTQNVCPICGESVVPGQAFCAECGYKLN